MAGGEPGRAPVEVPDTGMPHGEMGSGILTELSGFIVG